MKLHKNRGSILSLAGITLLALCGIFLTCCKKYEVTQHVIVKTEAVSEVTPGSCKAIGTLVDVGSTGISQHGFCWSLLPDISLAIDCNNLGPRNEKGQFFTLIEELIPGTEYYIWAYASQDDERSYGEAFEFTTVQAHLPEVETGEILNVTPNSAECMYNIISDGGVPVFERGLCWGTEPLPTIEGPHHNDGTGTGIFKGMMGELSPEQDYYVRAYAINMLGVAYGNQRTFATPPEAGLPEVHTGSVEDVQVSTAVVTGTISNDGGAEITDKGFCWSPNPDPTVDGPSIIVGSGLDPFELTIEGLAPNTTYFVQAFAVNIAGIGYGEQLEFHTLDDCGLPFVDERDGKTYQTVRIGGQCWMAQNLNIGKDINGEAIASDNETIEKYCYDNLRANCMDYGGLYTWEEMMQYQYEEGSQGVCPDGWHIPSDAEWKVLEMELGMPVKDVDAEDWRGTDQGNKLKIGGIKFWDPPNEGATNESGFTALGTGGRNTEGSFTGMVFFTNFWTSSWVKPLPWYRSIFANRADIRRSPGHVQYGNSVRCVKD